MFMLDDNPCMIVRSNLTSIMCVPQPHAKGIANLTVVVGTLYILSETLLKSAYEYTQSQTPVIQSCNSSRGLQYLEEPPSQSEETALVMMACLELSLATAQLVL